MVTALKGPPHSPTPTSMCNLPPPLSHPACHRPLRRCSHALSPVNRIRLYIGYDKDRGHYSHQTTNIIIIVSHHLNYPPTPHMYPALFPLSPPSSHWSMTHLSYIIAHFEDAGLPVLRGHVVVAAIRGASLSQSLQLMHTTSLHPEPGQVRRLGRTATTPAMLASPVPPATPTTLTCKASTDWP